MKSAPDHENHTHPGKDLGTQWKLLTNLGADIQKLHTELQCLHGAYVTQLDVFSDAFQEAAHLSELLEQANVLVQTDEVYFLSVPLVNQSLHKTLLQHEYVYLSLAEDVKRVLSKVDHSKDGKNADIVPVVPHVLH